MCLFITHIPCTCPLTCGLRIIPINLLKSKSTPTKSNGWSTLPSLDFTDYIATNWSSHCIKITSLEKLRASFLFLIIPRNPGLPIFQIINEVHGKENANASFISSSLGGGAHRLFVLGLSYATYNQLTGHTSNRPVNPDTLPVIVLCTSAQIGKQVDQHK